MTAKRTPKPKPEITHADVTMADTGSMTGVDAVASIDASLTVADTATMTGTDRARVTWRDWQVDDPIGPGDLITRDELLRHLVAEGISVSERDLLYWQKKGVIPHAERKWVGRVGHAYYPPWALNLIRALRRLQSEGKTLAEIRVDLRILARELTTRHVHVSIHDTGDETVSMSTTSHPLEAAAVGTSATQAELSGGFSATNITTPPTQFGEMAAEFARVYEESVGPHIDRVEVRLLDTHGVPHAFVFNLSPVVAVTLGRPDPDVE